MTSNNSNPPTGTEEETSNVVDGTNRDDLMTVAYTDADGDSIDGADGDDDVIYGYAGDDHISGGDGDDVIYGDGDSTSDGTTSSGEDIHQNQTGAGHGSHGEGHGYGHYGDDESASESFNDTINGGSGDDTIYGGQGDDTIYGGSGDDTIYGDGGSADATSSDSTDGHKNQTGVGHESHGEGHGYGHDGDGHDDTTAGTYNDTIVGGTGNDTIFGGQGDDLIYGGEGDDVIDGDGPSSDTHDHDGDRHQNQTGVGHESHGEGHGYGHYGDDHEDTGTYDDTIFGGSGDDTIIASKGTDTIDGGDDRDTYTSQGASSLTDETINVTVNDDGDGTVEKASTGTTDTVTSVENFVADEAPAEADEITLTTAVQQENIGTDIEGLDDNSSGTFTPIYGGAPVSFGPGTDYLLSNLLNGTSPDGQLPAYGPNGSYTITAGDEDGRVGDITFSNFETINFNIVCFARGTMIATRKGEVAIEDLREGDEVITVDRGFRPIRWIGSTTVAAQGKFAPVVIRKGAMGNSRDLRVSPQHRMLVKGWHVELLFGKREALVPAKALINDETVFQLEGGSVEYFHMMFDTHELIYAEGIPSESFHPGQVGMGAFAEETREEIFELFPELRERLESYGGSVRESLKVSEAKILAENPDILTLTEDA